MFEVINGALIFLVREKIVDLRRALKVYVIFIYFRSEKLPLSSPYLASGAIFQLHEQGRKGRCGALLRAFSLFANELNIFSA
ncbi:hypothetical protein [Novosphingobium terrae]|uniref:hypothetical protein n=1 Tax=Novosphingobium terrae TaxID=2726189 RepID=UPI00197D70BF|nr:hypothetical protein [Novosphingobium terrae]